MQKKSIYKYASEAGVPAGLYLTLMSACLLFSTKIQILPILIIPMAIGFPFLLWVLMRRISQSEPSYNKFSSLWLGGLYTVIFGTLICMFFSALYVVVVEPGFVHIYMNNVLEALEASPMAADYQATATLMREAMEAHILPTGLEFITTIAWFTCFTGSLLSLVIALIMSKLPKKKPADSLFKIF